MRTLSGSHHAAVAVQTRAPQARSTGPAKSRQGPLRASTRGRPSPRPVPVEPSVSRLGFGEETELSLGNCIFREPSFDCMFRR
jgi:hypothetical protein